MRQITRWQTYMFFSQFLFFAIIGFYMHSLVKSAGFTAWVSILTGSICGLCISYIAYRLGLRRPTLSIGQYGHEIVGKWIHCPLMVVVIASNLFVAALLLRQVVDFIGYSYLPDTPKWAVAAILGLCIAQAVRSGSTAIFRSAQGLFLFSIVFGIVIPILAAKELDMDMAVAFVTHFNLAGTWNGTVMSAALFAEMGSIVYLFSQFEHPQKIMTSLVWAAVTAVVVAVILLCVVILLFGVELTTLLDAPVLELVSYIREGTFLEYGAPLLLVFWLLSMLLFISLFLLISVIGVTHTLGLKDHRPFTYLMGLTMVYFSLYVHTSAVNIERLTTFTVAAVILLTTIVPVCYFFVDLLRSSKKKGEDLAQASAADS